MNVLTLVIAKVFAIDSFPLDGVLGTAVSIFIIINGVKLVIETMNPLIGEAPDKDFVKTIVDKILSYDGILGIHDLVIHSYGPGKYFVTVHMEVDCHIDVMISHEIIDTIERDFRNELGLELTGHLDPIETKDEFTNELKELVRVIIEELKLTLSGKINFHDFRIVKGPTHTNLVFDCLLPADETLSHSKISEMIQNEVSKIDGGPFYCVIQVEHSFI